MAALGNDFPSVLALVSRGEVHRRSTVARITQEQPETQRQLGYFLTLWAMLEVEMAAKLLPNCRTLASTTTGKSLRRRLADIKSQEELACVRRAAELTQVGLEAGIGAIREGVTDQELAAAMTEAMLRKGSHQLVMQPTVAVGYRSGLSHSQHDGTAARRGDSVFLELSGCHRHYSAPVMYTTTIGSVDDERNELYQVAQRTAAAILEHARPGVRACDVAAKAVEVIRPIEERIEFHYNFGYSVGISFPPHWLEESGFHIRAANDEPLREGMVFHLPLTMRVLGKYAAGTSRTIEITAAGAKVLTGNPAERT